MILRKTLISLLVLWFATLTACPPVTLAHAHAGGEHQHGHSGHDHQHRHDCHLPKLNTVALGSGRHWHVHLWFLGAEAHLRFEDQPEQSNGTACLGQLLLLRECVASYSDDLTREPGNGLASQPLDIARVDCESDFLQSLTPPISNPPLCDRARQQRSGVLLA